MSLNLAQLHAQVLSVRASDWSPEARAAAEGAFRACAVAIAEGLPFPYSLVRATPSHLTTNIGAVHIVCAEDSALGKLRRLRGDALCRPRWRFAGCLDELCPTEEGATCYGCLEVAERLSSSVGRHVSQRFASAAGIARSPSEHGATSPTGVELCRHQHELPNREGAGE
jgi:hypothetical protein